MYNENLISLFFVEKEEGDRKRFVLNSDLRLQFDDIQEEAKFLADLIRCWHGKVTLFCQECYGESLYGDDGTVKFVEYPEEEWNFTYKTPSTCGGCVRAQRILTQVFGSCARFNDLPFVTYHGDRTYGFTFEMLTYFAQHGSEATSQLIAWREQEKRRKEAEEKLNEERALREKKEVQLTKLLNGRKISNALKEQILEYVDNQTLKIVNKDLAVVVCSRSEWGSSGGVGYFSQVKVFYGSKSKMAEWQYRDRYSAEKDKPWLEVDEIGDVKIEKKDQAIIVEVELINHRYRSRMTQFQFDIIKNPPVSKLSKAEQKKFLARVEEEIQKVMIEYQKLWELKPQMLPSLSGMGGIYGAGGGYIPYRQPYLKEKKVRADLGIAAFIVEEQIDHRVSDAQIRYNLYVFTPQIPEAELLFKDHGYTSEGGAFLTIVAIEPGKVLIRSKAGEKEIFIK